MLIETEKEKKCDFCNNKVTFRVNLKPVDEVAGEIGELEYHVCDFHKYIPKQKWQHQTKMKAKAIYFNIKDDD